MYDLHATSRAWRSRGAPFELLELVINAKASQTNAQCLQRLMYSASMYGNQNVLAATTCTRGYGSRKPISGLYTGASFSGRSE